MHNFVIEQLNANDDEYVLLKYLTKSHSSEVSIAKGIPMKYLKYFKEVSAHKNAKKIRYRYRGKSKINYNRDQSYCLMNFADTFAVYYR